ncbi:MAG TPA: hypothetical protein VFA45_25815 [Actinomycetes bacterium]|jgi:hypothetical protein|nr:hypothetical protein [Actinomycetes bacterium]
MSDLQAIADRVEIEALRGELADAGMMRDYDRGSSLFTPDAVVRIPHIGAELVGREEIRAGGERLQGLLDYFVQTTHPGTISWTATPRPAVPTSHGQDAVSASRTADIACRTTAKLSPSPTKRTSGKTGAGSVPPLPPGPRRRPAALRRHRRLAV